MKLEISNLLSTETRETLNFTVFPNLFRSKEGEAHEVNNLEGLASLGLFKRRVVKDKKDTKVVVFGNFQSYPAQRSDRQVESLSCLVLDIDNQDSLKEDLSNDLFSTITADFLISKLEELNIEYLLYTTHSHYLESNSETEKQIPKLRLIIPFDSQLRTEYLETAYSLVLEMLCISKGVDSCGKKVSQPYFLPTCPEERREDAFIKANTGLRLSSSFIKEHAKFLSAQKSFQTIQKKSPLQPNKGVELYSFIEKHDLEVNKEKYEEGEKIYELRVCPLS